VLANAAFGVQAPERIDYYVAESVDQAMEILGLVVPERLGAAGGFAKPANFQPPQRSHSRLRQIECS
jgi:hypothetical protein